MTLHEGRPADTAGRMERELAVYDLLDSLGIPYLQVDHEAAFTMEACEEIDRALGVTMCKNLFLCNRQKTQFYLLLLPGEKKFETKVFSGKMGIARVSFADAEHMEEYLCISPGAVSVMGLMNDTGQHVQLVIDQDILKAPYIGCHPCVNTASIRLSTDDLKRFLTAVRHEAILIDL